MPNHAWPLPTTRYIPLVRYLPGEICLALTVNPQPHRTASCLRLIQYWFDDSTEMA